MITELTDEQVQELASRTKPCSAVLLWWGPERYQEGADTIERAHQRRILSLHADGAIAVLCPSAGSDTFAGVAVMTAAADEAAKIMEADPCVQAGMIRYEVHACVRIPEDTIPA